MTKARMRSRERLNDRFLFRWSDNRTATMLSAIAISEVPRVPNSLDVRPLILVVDDNAQNRALVQTTLEEEGQRVMLASGGDEALKLFEEHLPDCVLLDVRMPGTDGLVV